MLRGRGRYRRLFGEHQEPAEGFTLDNPLERPEVYGCMDELTDFETRIWRNFWEYANNPEEAAELGIRAAHGEAVSMQLRKDKVYDLVLRSSGGLSITATNPPAVLIDH